MKRPADWAAELEGRGFGESSAPSSVAATVLPLIFAEAVDCAQTLEELRKCDRLLAVFESRKFYRFPFHKALSDPELLAPKGTESIREKVPCPCTSLACWFQLFFFFGVRFSS